MFETASARRRFFLQRMQRSRPSRGSNFGALALLPPTRIAMLDVFGDLPYAAIGGVATRLYMPERTTQDLDLLVRPDALAALRTRLKERSAAFLGTLAFPDSTLGLAGETWQIAGSPPLDVIWSDAPWAGRAIAAALTDATGLKIVPLWALVALKLDASRGVDQGDLSRMLGLASDHALDEVRAALPTLLPGIEEDLESYITLGRLEVGRAVAGRAQPEQPA